MTFDGFALRTICQELKHKLSNARIDKIYQPEKDEIILSIRTQTSGNTRLLISANPRWARIHTSTEKKVNPSTPPAFCMLLRKYLEGGKIKEIKQVDFERILHIYIEALNDFKEWKTLILICEFMGRHSNIILVNSDNNIILDAIKKYGSNLSSYREVLPGKCYIFPPDQGKLNPLTCTYEQYVQLMWKQAGDTLLSSAIFNTFSGISPFTAIHICQAVNINPKIPVEQCGEYELSNVLIHIKQLVKYIDDNQVEVQTFYKNKQLWEFVIQKSKIYSSVNEALDTYYQKRLNTIRLDSFKANITRTIKSYLDRAYRKRFHQECDQTKANENEKYKLWGELLTAYAYRLNKGDNKAVLEDFYTGQPITIDLDPRYTPIQNAQKYFKIYNKSRSALKHLEQLMAKNQQEIDYLESVLVAIKQAENLTELDEIIEELVKGNYLKQQSHKKAKLDRSKPRQYISSDGFEILVGRNNRQNDNLTLKQSRNSDLWLHAKDIPGTHVIVRLPSNIKSINQIPDKTLEEAAGLAAYYSKAQESGKVAVDYTFCTNVRKPSGAKPGMVIYDNYWTITVVPLELKN
jgi:predicted ribosome quality control (RQC) complex YloA/Tae2 family protein